MVDFLKKFFDIKFWKFILVGGINTIVGLGINYGMLFLGDYFQWYNGIAPMFGTDAATVNFWVSSATNYTLTSILSYILNKHITFKSKGNTGRSLVRFVINIAVCYLIAYGIAQPLTSWVLATFFPNVDGSIKNYIATFVGMILFTGCNYIGQRFFAFKSDDDKKEKKN